MSWFKSFWCVAAVLFAVPAFAQQRPVTTSKPLRGYLIGGGGASISTPETSLTLTAEIAENMKPALQFYLGAGYYDNVMSQAARDQLVRTGTALTALTGTPWVFAGRDRARYFSAGVKFLVPTGSGLHPYVGGGFGAINFHRTIREQSRGNITEAYLAQFGSIDGVVDATQGNTTRPMGEVAVGVGAVISGAYIDVGYRYHKAFHNVDDSFDISQVIVAAGVKF
jgi:opacity protein-like surface antigen